MNKELERAISLFRDLANIERKRDRLIGLLMCIRLTPEELKVFVEKTDEIIQSHQKEQERYEQLQKADTEETRIH